MYDDALHNTMHNYIIHNIIHNITHSIMYNCHACSALISSKNHVPIKFEKN